MPPHSATADALNVESARECWLPLVSIVHYSVAEGSKLETTADDFALT
jgi:hypothetical protein